MVRFSKLLQTAYAPAYHTTWKEEYFLRVEVVNEATFELRDKQTTLVQCLGKGVACFLNPQGEEIEVIDFEHFINQFTQRLKAGQGKKCDFILVPIDHHDFFILNEISHLREESLHKFREEEEPLGKLEKSFSQLKSSIEKLYHSPEIATRLENTKRKVALFSVRLKEGSVNSDKTDPAQHALATFLLPSREQKVFKVTQGLPYGFVYERRIYPKAFSLN